MSVRIEVTGIRRAKKYLNIKKKQTDFNVNQGLNKAGLFLQGEVKQSIAGRRGEQRSVDTGRFLNSVSLNTTQDIAEVYTDLEYAKHLEHGTSRIRPRRHFDNSLKRNKNKINSILQSQVSNI